MRFLQCMTRRPRSRRLCLPASPGSRMGRPLRARRHTPAPAIRTLSERPGTVAPSIVADRRLPSLPVSAPQLTEGIVKSLSKESQLPLAGVYLVDIPRYSRQVQGYFTGSEFPGMSDTSCSPWPHRDYRLRGRGMEVISQSVLMAKGPSPCTGDGPFTLFSRRPAPAAGSCRSQSPISTRSW